MKTKGIYLVQFAAQVSGVTVGYKVAVAIDGSNILQGQMEVQNAINSLETMALSMAINIKANSKLSFMVFAEKNGMQVTTGTTRSILKVDVLGASNLTEGLAAYKTADQSFTSGSNVITGWDTKNTPGTFLAKNVSLNNGFLVVLRTGVFRITSTIIVKNGIQQARYVHF